MPEGRYVPAEIPSRNTQHCTAKKLWTNEMDEREIPTEIAEITMVFLWLIREDMWPDPKSDMKYPMERKKKSEPALP